MAKFYGKIGFAEIHESNGIWEESIVEKTYRGDIIRQTNKYNNAENVHDDVKLNMRVSIVADAYANENFFAIRYVGWLGSLWKVTSVEILRPRLVLVLGGVYNGPKP